MGSTVYRTGEVYIDISWGIFIGKNSSIECFDPQAWLNKYKSVFSRDRQKTGLANNQRCMKLRGRFHRLFSAIEDFYVLHNGNN